MLELLRYYFIRPIWESVFVSLPMPFRAILILIFVCLVIWIIIRLKNFWKELFRLFLKLLLLPEYFFVKRSIAKKNSLPHWLKYGELLNGIALFIIPIKENQTLKPVHFSWVGYPILILLIVIFPIFSCRERIKNSAPSTKVIDNAFLGWSSFETWILTGVWKEQNEYYLDFIYHNVQNGESLTSIWNSNSSGNIISMDEIVWANKSKYPTISENNIEPGWNLIIPVRKSLAVQYIPNNSSPKNIFRVKTQNKSGLWLRASKDINSAGIIFIPEGGEVDLLFYDNEWDFVNGKRGRWCRVKANDKEGWAWGGYLYK
jgi:hypothetical protein